MQPAIRQLTEGDLAFAPAQTEREGWDSTPETFDVHQRHDPQGCFVVEVDGRPVGMVTTTRYESSGWIGNLIVVPELRGRGIGRSLMTHALRCLAEQGIETVRLEADPPGIKLYRSLGFMDEYESLRFSREAAPPPETGDCPQAGIDALGEIAAFDAACFGDGRGRLLQLLTEQAAAVYICRQGGALKGYAIVVPSRFGRRIGPCVAAEPVIADRLLRTVLAEWGDAPLVLGIPERNGPAIGLLQSLGFTPTPSSYRMIYGRRAAAGDPARIVAIANGAVG